MPLLLLTIPRRQHEAGGAVFAVAGDVVLFQYAEGFGGVAGAHRVFGVEDVTEFVTGEAIGAGVDRIELGAEMSAAVLVPGEGFAVIAEVAGEGRHGMAGVGEFQHTRDDGSEIGVRVGGGWEDGELFEIEIGQGRAANLLPRCEIER